MVSQEQRTDDQRRRRREGFVIAAAALGILLFVFFQSQPPELSDRANLISNVIFVLLINLNIILLVLLVFLVGRNLLKLFYERRRKLPGAFLRSRLVLAFVAISLFPAILLFLIGVGFMTQSIESWFALRVENSLSGALNMVDHVYARLAYDAVAQARNISGTLTTKHLLDSARYEDLQNLVTREQEQADLARKTVNMKD